MKKQKGLNQIIITKLLRIIVVIGFVTLVDAIALSAYAQSSTRLTTNAAEIAYDNTTATTTTNDNNNAIMTTHGSNTRINVVTVLNNGTHMSPLTGMFTTLWQNGTLVQSTFSPANFIINNNGQTYRVVVYDYGKVHFDQWSDGITNQFHDLTTSNNETTTTTNLTAIYRAIGQ